MTTQPEMDPLDVLRAGNPVDVDRLSSASLARIRARVSEGVMTSTTRPRSLPWSLRALGLLGGVAAAGTLAIALFLGQGGGGPGVLPGSAIRPGSAACMEPYTSVAITHRTFAFEGIVTAIDGERVTFHVGAAWRGVEGSSITLEAPGMTGTAITSAGGPNLVVGQRYLVAGDDRFAWGCGYTQPYDDTIAADWAAALGG